MSERRSKGISTLLSAALLVAVISLTQEAGAVGDQQTSATTPEPRAAANVTTPTADWRNRILPTEFEKTADGDWVTSSVVTPFAFDELIYFWNIRMPRDQGFRLYVQVSFAPGDDSPWLYAGFWGKVKPFSGKRTNPTFDRGSVEQDQMLLKAKAISYRFKVVSEGDSPLGVLPLLGVMTTDNNASPELVEKYRLKPTHIDGCQVLDVPLRAQADATGKPMPDRCQSAALASAMQYFGRAIPLDNIVPYTTDVEYGAFGIWPRTLGAGYELGFDTYIDRFRDWDYVRDTLAQNKVILCSITMPANDTYEAPPYPKMEGHIVCMDGLTSDGRVLITDSSAQKDISGGYLTQWLLGDFQKIWMRNKGGVGMVICPPYGAQKKTVEAIAPFPRPIHAMPDVAISGVDEAGLLPDKERVAPGAPSKP